MPKSELYGAKSCPFTREMREWLEWQGLEFDEFDVEADPDALRRMMDAAGGQRMVPVLVEDGVAVHIGWHGRGCFVGPPPP